MENNEKYARKMLTIKENMQRINDTENTFWGCWLSEDFNDKEIGALEVLYEEVNKNLCRMYNKLQTMKEKMEKI